MASKSAILGQRDNACSSAPMRDSRSRPIKRGPCSQRRHAAHARRHGQIALADRTRLPGSQERTRLVAFRGQRLARLSPSRNAVRRRLWISHPRTSGDSPLGPTQREKPRLSWDAANAPLRPERHVANSVATLRKRLAFALAKTLYQCPCCKAILPSSIAYHNSS